MRPARRDDDADDTIRPAYHHPTCPGSGQGCTLVDAVPSAVIARRRGWCAGTILEGDEGYGWARIKITALGDHEILARSCCVGVGEGAECVWALDCRCWGEVAP